MGHLGSRRRRRRVADAAAVLTPVQRQVLALSAAEGLSTDQIAALLGLKPGEVENILAEALARFDRALQGSLQ